MRDEERPSLEAELLRLVEGGRLREVATTVVERYGPEILGFLVATSRDPAFAEEAFGQFCEDLWRGLPAFRGASSVRTWCYALARHAAQRLARRERVRRHAPLSELPELEAMAERVRTTTVVYVRSEVKARLDALRDALEPDDRALLVLRVDRRMSWLEIADVLGDAPPETDAARVRAAATLRKRFERLKERLRRGLEAELLPADA